MLHLRDINKRFILWLDLHITAKMPHILKPWSKAILLCAATFTMWFLMGWLCTWERYDQWSWVFDFIKPEQILDITIILVTIQVPFLIFGLSQIIDAGYVKREAFGQSLPLRQATLCTALSAVLIYLSPRASYLPLPFVVLVIMTLIIIFFTTSVAIQKRHYDVSRYVYLLASTVSEQIAKYRLRHTEILRFICKSSILGLSRIPHQNLDATDNVLLISKNHFLYDIDLRNLENTLIKSKPLINDTLKKDNLTESDWYKRQIIPSDWEIQHNKQPMLLIDPSLMRFLPLSDIADNRQDFAYASISLIPENVGVGDAKRLIRQIEKAFRYDTPKTHRLNEFWKFEDILDDLEEGLKEHIGDRNTTTYEEILSWLILLIETVDKSGHVEAGNYAQVQHEYGLTGQYYEAIYSRPTEILKEQLERAIDGDLFEYFRILMKRLRSMLGLEFKTQKFQPQITTLRSLYVLQPIIFHCLGKPKLNSDYLYFLIATLESQSRTAIYKIEQLGDDSRSDFVFNAFFVNPTVHTLLMRGMESKQRELKEKDIQLQVQSIIKLWQNYNLYKSSEESGISLLFKARCCIYMVMSYSEYVEFGLFPIQDLIFQGENPWSEKKVTKTITEIALECYTNKEYWQLLRLCLPLGMTKDVDSEVAAEEAIRGLWLDLILLQDEIPINIDAYVSGQLKPDEKRFFTGQYPSNEYPPRNRKKQTNILLALLAERASDSGGANKIAKLERMIGDCIQHQI